MHTTPGLDATHGVFLLCSLGIYYLARELILMATRYLNPKFYQKLHQNVPQGLRPYAVFYLGILLTACTAPLCAVAVAVSDPPTHPGLTHPGSICLSTRAVLWIAEIPLLRFSPAYVVHHILALGSLGLVLLRRWDLRPLYVAYAGLATEVLSDALALLRHHGHKPANQPLAHRLALANAASIVFLRAIPALAAALYLALDTASPHNHLDIAYPAGLLLYVTFCLTCAAQRLVSTGVLRFSVAERPARIEILRPLRIDISVFRLCLGTAMALAYLCTVTSFASGRPGAHKLLPAEVRGLALAGVEVGVAGLVGARLVPVVLEGPGFKTNKKLSVQGGVLVGVAWLAVTRTVPPSIEKVELTSTALSFLPLAEGIGRVGCFFAGCCGSAPRGARGEGKREGNMLATPGLQMLSAFLNLWSCACVVAAIGRNGLARVEVALLAAAANAAVRLAMQPLRSDRYLNDPYTALALVQYLGASTAWIVFIARQQKSHGTIEAIRLVVLAQGPAIAGIALFRHSWLSITEAASRTNGGKLALLLVHHLQRPIVLVSISGGFVGIVALVGYALPGDEVAHPAPAVSQVPALSHLGLLSVPALLLFLLPHVTL